MCDIVFENTKGIYAEATIQVSIVLVMKGELASETVNYDSKTTNQFIVTRNNNEMLFHVNMINLSQSVTYLEVHSR